MNGKLRESIIIRNFGPITDVTIEDIRPFTILIGESASGKSTILKVVALFRYLYKLNNIRFFLKNANIDRSPFRIRINDYFKSNGLTEYVKPHSEIRYLVTVNGHEYSIVYANGKLTNPSTMRNEDLVFFKGSFISENRNIIPTWAEKAASNRGATLGFYFHETFSDFDDATDGMKSLNLDFLKLKLEVRRVGGKKKYLIAPQEPNAGYAAIDLQRASSGIQTSTPLMAITHYYANNFSFKEALRRSILSYLYDSKRLEKFRPQMDPGELPQYVHLHVEEPELSLYPDAQIQMIDELVKLLFQPRGHEMAMMIATHSPYIINYINVLLQAGYLNEVEPLSPDEAMLKEDQVAVYKVENGCLLPLNGRNSETGQTVIDTVPLSLPMERIFQRYDYFRRKSAE